MMKIIPSLLLALCCTFGLSEGSPGLNYGMGVSHLLQAKNSKQKQEKSSYPTYYIEQPLDHFDNSSKSTFRQRYWVDTSYYKPGGPVILNNAGEGNAYPADSLIEDTVFSLMAKELNGIIVIIEHRYYGASHPPSSEDVDWSFLTVDQSLADMAHLIELGNKKIEGINYDVSANTTKWIIRGGSYSGNLAAWMRLKYPDLVYAAVSSSAPVQAQFDFYQYFNPIIQYGQPFCIEALQNIVDSVDDFLSNTTSESEKAHFKAGFGVSADTPDNEFADEVTGYASGLWQQAVPGKYPFDDMCQIFKNVKDPKEQLEVYRDYIKKLSDGQDGNGDSLDGDQVNAQSENPYANAWYWQTCSAFGYWQDAPPKSTPWYKKRVTSNLVTTQYYEDQCKEYFNSTSNPAIQQVNQEFQGWDLHLNRTIWINGEWDPWRPLSVASDDAPKRQNSTFEYSLMIPHGVHCFDYSLDDGYRNSLTELHNFTISTLKQWLN